MSIGRDDCDERETPVERMIEEFRKARARHLVNTITVKGDRVVESQRDAPDQVTAAGSTTTPTSDSND